MKELHLWRRRQLLYLLLLCLSGWLSDLLMPYTFDLHWGVFLVDSANLSPPRAIPSRGACIGADHPHEEEPLERIGLDLQGGRAPGLQAVDVGPVGP